MSQIATITASTTSPRLDAEGRGEHHFTVTNVSGRRIRFGFLVLPEAPPPGATFGDDEHLKERELAPGETTRLIVPIAVPPGARPGTYALRLRVYDSSRPGDIFTDGPLEQYEVVTGKTAETPQRPFPWLIVAIAAAVVILGGGIVAYFVWRDDGTVARQTFTEPRFSGLRLDWCLTWSTNCGRPAAVAFCRSEGFAGAASWEKDENVGGPGNRATIVIGEDRRCEVPQCDSFRTITCSNAALATQIDPAIFQRLPTPLQRMIERPGGTQ